VQALRQASRIHQKVPTVQDMLQGAGIARRDTRRRKGELVNFRTAFCVERKINTQDARRNMQDERVEGEQDMAVTDPIADMLTRIRNASFAKKEVVELKSSRILEEVVKILKKESFVANYKFIKDTKQGILRVYLKYSKEGAPAILGIKRISKPGLRIYKKADALPKVYGGLGIAVISTSKGLMTDSEAREKKLGGEVICYTW